MARKLELLIPDQIHSRIMQICKVMGITPQDLLMRAIVKTIEEFEKLGKVRTS